MTKLRAVQWPANFKIYRVQPYDSHANPEQWLVSYAITVRAGGGDTDVMANYLPVMLQPAAMNWLTSLQPDIIDSSDHLKWMFIENYKATCERSVTKHDLARVYQKTGEILQSYIRRFSKVRNWIPDILEAEVITCVCPWALSSQ